MSIVDVLAKLRGGKKAPGAAELEAALKRIDLAALGEQVFAAERARRDALLGGAPEAEVAKLEGALTLARNELERGQIAADHLRVQVAEAREREEADRLDRDLATVRAEAEAAGAVLAREYEEAATAIAKAFVAADAAQAKVRELNERLRAAGRHDDLVVGAIEKAFPPIGKHVSRPDPATSVSLPPLGRFPGLGEAREAYEMLGLIAPAQAAE